MRCTHARHSVESKRTIDLAQVFKTQKPVLRQPSPTISLKPQNYPKPNFIDMANSVLSQYKLKQLSTETISDKKKAISARVLPTYHPMKCEPVLVQTKKLCRDVDAYLTVNREILKSPKLPYLPSAYTKSPNFEYVDNRTPFATKNTDIKGILSPFTQAGCFKTLPRQTTNAFFSATFVPASHPMASVRKSRSSIVVFSNSDLLFNKIPVQHVSDVRVSSKSYPGRFAVIRRQNKLLYRDLYFDYIQRDGGKAVDGILFIWSYKFANTVEDRDYVTAQFEKMIREVPNQKLSFKSPSWNFLEKVCNSNGLDFDRLFPKSYAR